MPLSSFLQKLMFVNQFSINDGEIKLLGDSYIMLNSESILVLQEIDKSKTYNMAKSSSKADMKSLVSHAQVYKDIKAQELKNIANLNSKIGKSDEGTLRTLESLFDIYGLGKLKILDLNNEKKTVLVQVEKSTIALKHKEKEKGKSKEAVCALTAGIIAGIFSFIFKKDVQAVEQKCLGKGDEYCEFHIG